MRSAPTRARRIAHEVVLGRVPRAHEPQQEIAPLGLPPAGLGEDRLELRGGGEVGVIAIGSTTSMAVSVIRSMTASSNASFESK